MIEKSIEFNNKKVIINLYSLKIVQIHHLKSKNEQVANLASKIHSLSKEIDYNYGFALYYSHMWYIEKFKGNKGKSKKYIEKSIAILEKSQKEVLETIEKMHSLAEEINYTDGLALCFTYKWYIEKFQGDKINAKKAMYKSLEILNQLADCDRYIHHFILYSYAVEKWLE